MLSGRTYDPDEAHTENPDGTCIKGYGVRIGNEEIKEKDIKGFDQNLQKNSTFLKIERCCFSMCFRTFEWILKENSHRRNPQSRLRYILSHDTMSESLQYKKCKHID